MATVTEYCTVDDLETLGIGARAFGGLTIPQKQTAIKSASEFIDSYLRNQYTLPLQAPVGEDIKRCCAILACYFMLVTRGFDPAADGNEIIIEERDRQVRWLEGIRDGKTAPNITDSSPEQLAFGTGPRVITSSSRGYTSRDGCGRGAFTRD
jgi:phage gp36-like protein